MNRNLFTSRTRASLPTPFSRALRRFAALACVVMLCASSRAQLCDLQWLDGPASPLPYTNISTASSWDPDGDGPLARRIVVGEYFRDTEYINWHSVVRWFDTTQWHETAVTASNDPTRQTAMCEWDPDGDGPLPTYLVVAQLVDPWIASEVVLFDGTNQARLGDLFDDSVMAVCAVDDDANPATAKVLYAAGEFESCGGAAVHYLARWTGTSWEEVGGGLEWRAQHLVAWDRDGLGPLPEWLAVAGEFVRAGGGAGQGAGSIPAGGVAIWNGTLWSAMPAPLQFLTTNGANRPLVATMTTWDPDDEGPQTPRLVVGGWFSTPDLTIRNLVAWDGQTMQGFALTNGGNGVLAAAQVDHDFSSGTPRRLVIVADENFSSNNPAYVYAWDGAGFARLSADPLVGVVGLQAIIELGATEFAERRVVFIGDFERVGTLNTRHFVQWTQHGWTPLCPSVATDSVLLLGNVTLMPVPREDGSSIDLLVTGTALRDDEGVAYSAMSLWDGAWFTHVDQPAILNTRAAAAWDPDGSGTLPLTQVIAGDVGGAGGSVVYRRSGNEWVQLGGPLGHVVVQLVAWDHDANPETPDILVSRGTLPDSIRRFDGSQWRSMALPASTTPRRVCVADLDGPGGSPPALYVACAGAPEDALLAFLSPTQESVRVGGGIANFANPSVAATNTALLTWDTDGPGPVSPVLVWTGWSVLWQGQEITGILSWNGSAWTRLSTNGPYYNGAIVSNAAAWYRDGPQAPQALAVIMAPRHVYWRTASHAWDHFGYLPVGSTLAPWDSDGQGPIPERLVSFGTSTDWTGRNLNYGLHVFGSATPWLAHRPANTVGLEGNTITLVAAPAWGYAERAEGLNFKWRRNGVSLDDGPGGASPGGGVVSGASGLLRGSRDLTLTIAHARPSDAGSYDLLVFNSCGSAASGTAEVDVIPICPADFDGSGTLDQLDVDLFLHAYEIGDDSADLNCNGGIEPGDLAAFFDAYSSQCI